ncbi:MAG: TIGR04282 family arsenosugar biosynthesis glycosyltransferase [Planctomycetota bacterium]
MATLIVFTRYPEPGSTKTRLIPALGPEGAAELQGLMTAHSLEAARAFAAAAPNRRRVRVRFAGGTAGAMAERFGADLAYEPQGEGSLGERLERAFEDAFALDGPVLVIGADCPDLDAAYLEQAREALDQTPLVLGPARDGGYTLLGLRKPFPKVFRGIDWSTERVLEQTRAIAARDGLATRLLPTLDDVDTPEDLARVEARGGALRERFAALSRLAADR